MRLALLPTLIAVLCLAGLISTAPFAAAQASAQAVIYSFCDNAPACPDGAFPYAGVISDVFGNLYGTTYEGGGGLGCNGAGCGSVFRLRPSGASSTGWSEKILHGFAATLSDGLFPEAALISDAAGNLYGTTSEGGNSNLGPCDVSGCGIVFELSPGANDEWTETILYAFCSQPNCKDGVSSVASLILDASGNLYGTATAGGISGGACGAGCGTVFELSPDGNGQWTFKTLYRFQYAQGANPEANLTFDAAGNLYGTTSQGGANGIGTVFELSPGSDGTWNETVLHSFNTSDGRVPLAPVIFDASGNLYGTTFLGGTGAGCIYSYGCGTVFELSPSSGTWNETVLYNFCSQTNCTDGANPFGGLVSNKHGVMYGTTYQGGEDGLGGVVYQLAFNTTWTESLVYSLGSTDYDASSPEGSLVFGLGGNLYGTGQYGGRSSFCNEQSTCGAVFTVNPGSSAMRLSR